MVLTVAHATLDTESGRFFHSLEPELQSELYKQGEISTFGRGQTILKKGSVSGLLYILLEGMAKVSHCENEKHLMLAVLRPGDMFGELSMINGQATTANILSMQNSTVLKIKREKVYSMLQNNASFMCLFLETLSQRTRQVIENICVMGLEDVYGRLRRTLTMLAKENGIQHKITGVTHSELAEMVGASREMVSIIMKDLKMGDYLRVDGRTITLLKDFPQKR